MPRIENAWPTEGSGYPAAAARVDGPSPVYIERDRLDAGRITIRAGEFSMPAYCAKPQEGSNLPVIFVISEIFGVHEYIADVARRFAQLGYLAVAPELFVRQGDAKACTAVDRLVAEIIEKVPDAQVMVDLDAMLAWASASGGDIQRLGVTGFCWGGRISWMYAAHQPRVRAGVAWYGKLRAAPTPQRPLHPIDVTGHLGAPVLGLYGGQDRSIPMEAVAAMREALATGSVAARASTIEIYPDAGHAFHADHRPSYRRDDAEDGWRRCLAWFAQHGV